MATVKKIPMRQCIGCGQKKSKRELVRIVKPEEGEICIDATGKKNGRGAYICNSPDCLMLARKKKAFERSLDASVSDETYEMLLKELSKIDK